MKIESILERLRMKFEGKYWATFNLICKVWQKLLKNFLNFTLNLMWLWNDFKNLLGKVFNIESNYLYFQKIIKNFEELMKNFEKL